MCVQKACAEASLHHGSDTRVYAREHRARQGFGKTRAAAARAKLGGKGGLGKGQRQGALPKLVYLTYWAVAGVACRGIGALCEDP